jgi:aspartyl-tRNA synthetase
MERTHYNGKLRKEHQGQQVTLIGWVSKRRHLGSILFIDLRDRTGIVQINVPEPDKMPDVRGEYLLQVKGVVKIKDVANKNLATGEIEVVASDIFVIGKSATPPLIIDDVTDALEDVRLRHRYLDLRRPIMQKKLMMRHQIVQAFHHFFDEHGFIEVETPLLTLSTPGGARDYLVPSRLQPGTFYALPQSPQIYKQLLMIGGLERYYQLARCFRDEDLRADRQPDFTQVDVEMSFLDQNQVLTLLEQAIAYVVKKTKGIIVDLPLRRITYKEALESYGSDHPDTRYDLKLFDLKPLVEGVDFPLFSDYQFIKAMIVKDNASVLSRSFIDKLSLEGRKFHLNHLFTIKYNDGQLSGSVIKYFTEQTKQNLIDKLSLTDGDTIIASSSNNYRDIHFGLGAIRSTIAKQLSLIDESSFDVLWVVDFPLFEKNDGEKFISAHHPFTKPHDEDIALLQRHPEQVRADAYDMIINGNEVGGGSMRIYDQDQQKQIFKLLGMTEEDIKKKFGWFIDAFKYGTPPHGGIAFGLDRIVMILTETDNIRDVIAFPKNVSAVGPLEKTPASVDEEQLDELGIKIKEKK